jgi:hypothetical protein
LLIYHALTEEHLLNNGGFQQEVMKGWYIAARPNDAAGESTLGMHPSRLFAPQLCANPLAAAGLFQVEPHRHARANL